MDIERDNNLPLNVQYEVYDAETKLKVNMSKCENTQIIILFPTDLDNETIYLYEELNNKGFNLFDPNDSFYNDICTIYSNLNDSDLCLSDRRKYYNNVTLCDNDCDFNSYNKTIGKTNCTCDARITSIEESINEFKEAVLTITSFLDNLKLISNIEIVKCYNVLFSNISKNKD